MLDKPKVLVVLNSLHAGGAQKVTITLFNHLSQDYDVHYLVLDETEPDLKKKIHRKASVTFLPKHRQRIHYRFFYMARFIRQLNPDVIFSTMNKTNQAVLIANKMSFKKVSVIVREANYLSLKYSDMGFIRKGLLKYLYNRVANKVMTISEEIGDDLHENGENGYLFRNDDVNDLAEKLRMAFQKPLKQAGTDQRFSIDHIYQEYLQLFLKDS